jgi:protein O-mannosyl-transferase
VPWPLCADYTGYFRFGAQPALPVAAAVLVGVAFLTAIVLAARRGQGLLAFGLGWFVVALGPVSNLLPVPVPAAERFLYLPLAGVALAAAAGAGRLSERLTPAQGRRAALAVAAVLVVFALLVHRRHDAWRDDQTLWQETLRRNPRSCGAHSAVGGNLLTRGIAASAPELLRQSIAHQEEALRLCADASDVGRAAMMHTRLGAAHVMLGDLDPAAAELGRAIDLAPRYALPVVWLGYARFLAGDRARAAALLEHAVIDLGPPDPAVAEVAQRYLDKL